MDDQLDDFDFLVVAIEMALMNLIIIFDSLK